MLRYWRSLEKTQYLSLQELKEIQWRRLQKLYAFLWKENDFYRTHFQNAGLTPESLKDPDDIKKLPVLTKKVIRKHGAKMLSRGYNKRSLLHFKTGGSTGKALDIYLTEECSILRNACTRRHDCWTGWRPGEPIAAAWGNPDLPRTIKEKVKNSLVLPYIFLDTMAVNIESVRSFVKSWNRVRPTLLFGHAHSLYILAQYVHKLECDEIRPKGILSTSMMLLPHERKLIEDVFSCKVTDRYGCEEVSLIGCECEEHEGMHMNIEHLVIEFINDDGSDSLPDEPGKIVVTDLMNYAMPFVRYNVEDVGIPVDRACSCGRGLPLMGKVAGRIADFLLKKDGTKVAGISLIENTLTKIAGIDQMQIVQHTINDFTINIVAGIEYNRQTESELKNYFQKIFPDTTVSVIEVEEIVPEPSGKYRFSVCKIRGAQ